MIIRIVKMDFAPEHTGTFEALFERQRAQIRQFPGCRHLELWRETAGSSIYFTYSHWDGLEALEAYRASTLFRETWAATKILFQGKPQAWSVEQQVVCD